MKKTRKNAKITKNTSQISCFLQNCKKNDNGNICVLCHNIWSLNQLIFRTVQHPKMTVWTSVLWKIFMHSKALSCMGLEDAHFWSGSKEIWDAWNTVFGKKLARNGRKTAICESQILVNLKNDFLLKSKIYCLETDQQWCYQEKFGHLYFVTLMTVLYARRPH